LIEEQVKHIQVTEQTSFKELEKIIKENNVKCPVCNKQE
jgi:glycyl-tRNA synthetase (class II)